MPSVSVRRAVPPVSIQPEELTVPEISALGPWTLLWESDAAEPEPCKLGLSNAGDRLLFFREGGLPQALVLADLARAWLAAADRGRSRE
jgi:hypothetical protein